MSKIEFLNEEHIELAKKNFEKLLRGVEITPDEIADNVKELSTLVGNIASIICMHTKEEDVQAVSELTTILVEASREATRLALVGLMLECIDIPNETEGVELND